MAFLEMRNIVKSFSGVQVLKDVHFDLGRGEVVALLGQNGAGKSTLIKILSGYYSKDSGNIILDGQEVHFRSPAESLASGIRVIYQELEVFPDLTVAENIFAGSWPVSTQGRIPIVNRKKMNEETRKLMNLLGEDINPDDLVKNLGISEKQIVEIARALAGKANIIVMDEPTAALSQRETKRLFAVIRRLKEQGVGIIYITHRLEEVFEISDRVIVLRDGKNAGTFKTTDTSWQELVQAMIGRSLEELYPSRESSISLEKILVRVEGLGFNNFLKNISFELHAGEIIGFFGLIGSGINELALTLFGALPSEGRVWVEGRLTKVSSPILTKKLGIGFIPADRKREGIVPEMSVKDNITLASLDRNAKRGFIQRQKETNCACEWSDRLQIKFSGLEQSIKSLSGGNQQKVVLARWLATQSKILVASEPTQGVDVGARIDIYRIFDNLAKEGMGIIILSSDLPEVMALSDTIFVMEGGKIVGKFSKGEADQQRLLYLAMGGTEKAISHK
ncbi:MAG: ribose transport system ATP-binding protein [Candidatus Atribacteria bacterium]|nr:ribose transport system ATP-binding protein [Candidatus Atribacteria bacterium]